MLEPGVAFGRVLRRLRQNAGLTQEAFAFEADLQRTYVSLLELGQQQPSLATILKIAAAFHLPAKDLIGQVEDELRAAD